ncbi:MAG: SUF system NifU family Fe-S cluster assembly protein [Oxalobacteraceae bacterium]|nr:SUF system NifU family Fe-S cluster assembly protein [Oxalobacteraceae bacterium]
MNELRELYQEVIFDHYRKPRNCHVLDCVSHHAEGYNPLCGDQVTVYLKVEDGVIEDLSFKGTGCAISTASASLMTEALKGKKLAEVEHLFNDFHRMVTGSDSESVPHPDLGKLEALAGVHEFPARVKCATLAWHTLQAALKNQSEPVKTE